MLSVAVASVIACIGSSSHNTSWNVTRNAFCYPNQVPVTWSVTFDECWKTCVNTTGCKQFSFTNNQWKGRTGCSLVPPCTGFCTTGACRNWDTFDCPTGAASCQQPVAPAPAPGRFLSGIFASHMVLQRDVPSLLSGSNVKPGDVVTVTVSGAAGAETVTHNVTAADQWYVYVVYVLFITPLCMLCVLFHASIIPPLTGACVDMSNLGPSS